MNVIEKVTEKLKAGAYISPHDAGDINHLIRRVLREEVQPLAESASIINPKHAPTYEEGYNQALRDLGIMEDEG